LSILAAATRKPFGRTNEESFLLDDGRLTKETKRSRSPQIACTTNQIENGQENLPNYYIHDSKVSISFAPTFVPATKPSCEIDDITDAVIEDPTRNEDYVVDIQNRQTTHIPAIFSSPQPPMKHRRSGKVNGTWVKRLMALRNTRKVDAVRLQNQAYARHSKIDLNNPRKRANSSTDVTILGNIHQGIWNLPEESTITILGYIHSQTHVNKGETNKEANPEQDHNQGTTVRESKFFAWVTFKVYTARSIGLDRGDLLRLYNAVILPCPHATELILPQSLLECNNAKLHYCKNIVVCTDLCERIDSKT
jgi:hypothetical protein